MNNTYSQTSSFTINILLHTLKGFNLDIHYICTYE
jgi:hypothetical protein